MGKGKDGKHIHTNLRSVKDRMGKNSAIKGDGDSPRAASRSNGLPPTVSHDMEHHRKCKKDDDEGRQDTARGKRKCAK